MGASSSSPETRPCSPPSSSSVPQKTAGWVLTMDPVTSARGRLQEAFGILITVNLSTFHPHRLERHRRRDVFGCRLWRPASLARKQRLLQLRPPQFYGDQPERLHVSGSQQFCPRELLGLGTGFCKDAQSHLCQAEKLACQGNEWPVAAVEVCRCCAISIVILVIWSTHVCYKKYSGKPVANTFILWCL